MTSAVPVITISPRDYDAVLFDLDGVLTRSASVLAARWIGSPLIEAWHFALGTALLSILGHDPHHPVVAVIALWNAASGEKNAPICVARAGAAKSGNPRAIARWENEGGEIPAGAGTDLLKKNER